MWATGLADWLGGSWRNTRSEAPRLAAVKEASGLELDEPGAPTTYSLADLCGASPTCTARAKGYHFGCSP